MRSPLTWASVAWLSLNVVWLRANRWTRYAELDEAGYARFAIAFERQPTWSGRWQVLSTEGFHGPLQALLSYVPMKLTAGDLRVVIAMNVLLTVVTALATADLTATVAGPRAAVVAGILVLLLPGVVEFSRTALTATLPMAFIAVALAALARSGGLQHLGWSLTAGIAGGCMVAGRSMAVGFLPALAVAGLAWAWSTRTRAILAVRNGLLLTISAIASIGWWWVARWPGVGDYLFKGGSSDTARVTDPLGKSLEHAAELGAMTGLAFVLGLLTVLVLLLIRSLRSLVEVARGRRRLDTPQDGDPPVDLPSSTRSAMPEVSSARIAAWPLVASVVTGLLTLGVSTAFGVGFVLPLIPATVAACVGTAHRVLRGMAPWAWTAWAGAVVAVSLVTVVMMPDRGMDARLVWCGPGQTELRPYCSVHGNADGDAWRRANDHVADRIAVARMAIPDDRPTQDLAVAMTRRDLGLSENMVSLSMEVRHRAGINLSQFFVDGFTVAQQLDDVVARADLVVAVEDLGGDVILSMHSPTPDEVLAAARGAGFRACEQFETPDDRRVTVLRAPEVPSAACGPLTEFGP